MRTQGKPGDKGFPIGNSKLTREQWDQVVAWIHAGNSVRQATVKIHDTWGIEMAVSAVAANRSVQEYRSSQRLESAEQASSTIQSKVGEVADILVSQIDSFKKERKALKRKVEEFDDETDKKYMDFCYRRLEKVDDELRKHMDSFSKLYEQANKGTGLQDKLKEQNEAEAQVAIDALLESLAVEVSTFTLADRILDAGSSPTKRNDLSAKSGEAAPGTGDVPLSESIDQEQAPAST